mgnify:FL=1
MVIKPDLVLTALRNLYKILQPGGVLAASIMTLWKPDDPLYTEWKKEAIDQSNGWLYKRIAKSWYDPEAECERTEDIYQLWIDDQLVKEESHSRSPATRSYTQNQAKHLFESAGFRHINLFHEFTYDPVNPSDTFFTVVAHR